MNKKNLPIKIYDIIRNRILSFKLLPGVKISDKEIAAEFGISRTPVREALIRLTNQGLVTSLHNRGFTVRQFSIKEIEDIYLLREAMEILAVKLVIQRLKNETVDQIDKLIEEYPTLMTSGSRKDFNRADEHFHLFIAEHSENALLKEQLASLHDQLAVLRRHAYLLSQESLETYEDETFKQHLEVLDYIRNHDEKNAVDAMSRHVRASMDSVIAALKDNLDSIP